MRKEFLIYGAPIVEQPEIDEVVKTLKSGWLGTGPKVAQFEKDFGKYQGVNFAIAVNSCTAALHLAMLAIDIQPQDEVIVPTMTFAASINAVIHAGGKPVFVDCQKDTMNMDPVDLEAKITDKTKAIVVVHFAGRACDMDSIMKLANKNDLKVIEDCAHAIETEYKGKKVGTFGDLGCFSFYVTKNIITGEGGMLITNNKEYADKIKIRALHGMSQDAWDRFSDEGYKHYRVVYAGFKYNMTDIQAAIGIHQLSRIDKYWKRREEIWQRYNEVFKGLPVTIPADEEEKTRHAYHLYTVLLDLDKISLTRDQFLNEMTKRNIGVGVHYTALHLHPFYQECFGTKEGDFPNAEWIGERTVSLPLSPKLTSQDENDVIEAVTEILRR